MIFDRCLLYATEPQNRGAILPESPPCSVLAYPLLSLGADSPDKRDGKRMKTRLLLIILFLLTPVCRAGGRSADSTAVSSGPHMQDVVAATAPTSGTTGLVARIAFSLVVVVALIWGAVYLMRRFSGYVPSARGKSHVRVLGRAHIAPKKAIYIVQIGSRSLAVGVTDTQMAMLAELDPEETLSAYTADSEGSAPVPFASLLKDVRTRFWGEGVAGGAS